MDKKLADILIKVFLTSVTILFIFTIVIKRFVYFRPSSHFIQTKETYQNINHGHLHGWLLQNDKSNKIILICHGNAGNISHEERRMIDLRNLGYSVLAFDYSGYGKSSGVPSEQQLYDDASTMTALLRQTYSPEQIVIYGVSLGGPIATYVARRYSIPTLILEAPLPSIKIFIENKYPFISFLSPLFPEFDTFAYLDGFRGKSLIMHSPVDDMIPYETVKNLTQICSLHIQIAGSHTYPMIPWNDVKSFIETSVKV